MYDEVNNTGKLIHSDNIYLNYNNILVHQLLDTNKQFTEILINPNLDNHELKMTPTYYNPENADITKVKHIFFAPIVEIFIKSDSTIITTVEDLDNVLKNEYDDNHDLMIQANQDRYDLIFTTHNNAFIWDYIQLPFEIDTDKLVSSKWIRREINGINNYLLEFVYDDGTSQYWQLNDGKYKTIGTVTVTSDEDEKINRWETYIHFNVDVPMENIHKMEIRYTDYYTFGGLGYQYAEWIKGSEKTTTKVIKSTDQVSISNGVLDWYTAGIFGKKGSVPGIDVSNKEGYAWRVFLGDMNKVEYWKNRDSLSIELFQAAIRPSNHYVKEYTVLTFWYEYQGIKYVSSDVVDPPLAWDNTNEISDFQLFLIKASNTWNNLKNHDITKWIINNIDYIIISFIISLSIIVLAPVLSLSLIVLKSLLMIFKFIFVLIKLPFILSIALFTSGKRKYPIKS